MIEFDTRNYCHCCKQSFKSPVELQQYDDTLVDRSTPKEDREMHVCPSCGSTEWEEAQHWCEECGEWLPDDKLKSCDDGNFYLCQSCISAMKQKREDADNE